MSKFGLYMSLLASIFWGLNYTIFEKVSHNSNVNLFGLMFFEYVICAIVMLIISLLFGDIKYDYNQILEFKTLFFANIAIYLIANTLIIFSIKYTNASIAGLIEITYPLFIILFTYFLLGKIHMGIKEIVGGAFILIGLFVILFKQ